MHGMATRKPHDEQLLAKIRSLPPEKVAEVEDFVEFLHQRERERELRQATSRASESSFREAWENRDDAAYDAL
jgi:hypothetical protein